MAFTQYFKHTTGETVYAKLISTYDATWANDIVSMSEIGSTGIYSAATFVSGGVYGVFEQVGGSPSSGDTTIGTIIESVSQADIAAILLDTGTTLPLGQSSVTSAIQSSISALNDIAAIDVWDEATLDILVANSIGVELVSAIGDITSILVDTGTTLPASIAGITSGSVPTRIYTNPTEPNRIELIKGPDGNAYDGTAWDKLSWDAGIDIDGDSFSFKVVTESERLDDNPTTHLSISGTGVGQLAEPTVTNDHVASLPTSIDLWFFVTLEYSSTSHKTIAQGPACIT